MFTARSASVIASVAFDGMPKDGQNQISVAVSHGEFVDISKLAHPVLAVSIVPFAFFLFARLEFTTSLSLTSREADVQESDVCEWYISSA